MKTIRTIYRAITVLLTAAIIAVTLLALLLGVSGMDRQNPKSIFGLRAFIVLSESMTPTFGEGSVVVIMETAASKLKVGDIITYMPIRGDETLLTHRIVRLDGEGENVKATTRGDANNMDDPNAVSPESILGRVIYHQDGLGTFIVNLRTPLGIAGMVVTIAVGLFIIPYLLTPQEANTKTKNQGTTDGEAKREADAEDAADIEDEAAIADDSEDKNQNQGQVKGDDI